MSARSDPVPSRSPVFAHLSLAQLRAYRAALGAEESRVSYWRRIVHGRLDLTRAVAGTGGRLRRLPSLLADARVRSGRNALLAAVPIDDVPPLPDLAALWLREPLPGEDRHNAALCADLARAEGELSAYRAVLHRQLEAATRELVARYAEDPLQCLCALPRLPTPPRPTRPPAPSPRDQL